MHLYTILNEWFCKDVNQIIRDYAENIWSFENAWKFWGFRHHDHNIQKLKTKSMLESELIQLRLSTEWNPMRCEIKYCRIYGCQRHIPLNKKKVSIYYSLPIWMRENVEIFYFYIHKKNGPRKRYRLYYSDSFINSLNKIG